MFRQTLPKSNSSYRPNADPSGFFGNTVNSDESTNSSEA